MKIRPILLIVLALVTTMAIIGFATVNKDRGVCNKVIISIDNQLNNHFIDDNDVLAMITNGHTEIVEGVEFNTISIRDIENRVTGNSYVKDAEIFRDLKGNLIVNVLLRRPIARIIQFDGPDAYISEDGTILPVSDKFSSRVLLVGGANTKAILSTGNLKDTDYNELFNLVEFIKADAFWTAQIAQVEFQKNGEVKLLPQITKQDIEFGDLSLIENKFNRLKIFYKEILPRKGWNSYSRVNVKYRDQIICE